MMKKIFLQVCKKHPEDVLKPNLNNCLKIGSFIMLFIHLLQGFTILGYKVDEILSDNENWHCNIWPRDSDLPCLSKKKYALAFIRLHSFDCFASCWYDNKKVHVDGAMANISIF